MKDASDVAQFCIRKSEQSNSQEHLQTDSQPVGEDWNA
jgi:hypothetical protein